MKISEKLNSLHICIISQMRIKKEHEEIKFAGKGIWEAKRLSEQVKKVTFIAFSQDKTYNSYFFNNKKFSIHLLPLGINDVTDNPLVIFLSLIGGYFRLLVYLFKILRNFRPDVVKIENIILIGIPAWMACRLLNIPYFLWVAGPELKVIETKLKFYNKLRHLIFSFFFLFFFVISRNAKLVINISPESEDFLKKCRPRNYLMLNVNYVDTKLFKARRYARRGKDKNIILYVGRIENEKGIMLLIRAIEALYKKRHDFELWIVGDGSLKKKLEQYTVRKCLPVKWFGLLDIRHLQKFYLNADIFVLPSLVEGPSAALLEAMASGLAIVSTTGPIKNRINGILVQKDIVSITNALDELLQNKSLRKRLAENARKSAIELASIYERIMLLSYLVTTRS